MDWALDVQIPLNSWELMVKRFHQLIANITSIRQAIKKLLSQGSKINFPLCVESSRKCIFNNWRHFYKIGKNYLVTIVREKSRILEAMKTSGRKKKGGNGQIKSSGQTQEDNIPILKPLRENQ